MQAVLDRHFQEYPDARPTWPIWPSRRPSWMAIRWPASPTSFASRPPRSSSGIPRPARRILAVGRGTHERGGMSRVVLLDNEAVHALADPSHRKHRRVVGHVQIVARRKARAVPVSIAVRPPSGSRQAGTARPNLGVH